MLDIWLVFIHHKLLIAVLIFHLSWMKTAFASFEILLWITKNIFSVCFFIAVGDRGWHNVLHGDQPRPDAVLLHLSSSL